jgi:hypothetical protein
MIRMFRFFRKPTIKVEIYIMAKLTQAEVDALAAQVVTNTAAMLANVQPDIDDSALKAAVDAQTAALNPVAPPAPPAE